MTALIVWAAVLWLRGPVDELAQLYNLQFALKPPNGFDSALLLALSAGLGWLGASLSLRQTLRES